MITRRRALQFATSVFAPALLTSAARAQAWPTRFVRLIVPYPAGGGADAIARILGQRLTETWGQQVLIENRAGAGGTIAAELVVLLYVGRSERSRDDVDLRGVSNET